MNKTQIEWVKNPDGTQGFTWNPITGCLNGCEYCYARKLANTRLKERYLANKYGPAANERSQAEYYMNRTNPFYPRFWSERMWLHELVGSKRKPRGVFTCDISDLFGIGVPEEWTKRILAVISLHPRHRFYLLTKQPQNLMKFSPFPDNCWVGVTATNTRMFVPAINWLDEIETKIKYISFEPLLGRIPLNSKALQLAGINWVIIGAMTCGGADLAKMSCQYPELTPMPYGNRYTLQPKIEWVEKIVKACDEVGIPVFLKNNLYPLIHDQSLVKHRGLFRTEYGLRQEMPK